MDAFNIEKFWKNSYGQPISHNYRNYTIDNSCVLTVDYMVS